MVIIAIISLSWDVARCKKANNNKQMGYIRRNMTHITQSMHPRRTNEEWGVAIRAKVASVLDDDAEHLPPSDPIASPDDPRLPYAIDHTLLTPDATSAQIDRLCKEAVECRFKVSLLNYFM